MPVDEMLATPAVTQKDMPYVSFYTDTIEDVKKTNETGTVCNIDQDFALIIPPGGKTTNKEKIQDFWSKMQQNVKAGRIPDNWVQAWKHNYELYKKGQQIPLEGTPIRGWKMLPGSIQEELIRINILTVEDLATINDEGLKNVGMGGREWQRRALAWVAQNQDRETVTIKMTALQRKVEELVGQVKALTDKNDELETALEAKRKKQG